MNIRGYVKTVFEQEKPLKFLVSRILIRSKLCKLFIIKQKNYNLRFDPVSSSGALWINIFYHSHNPLFILIINIMLTIKRMSFMFFSCRCDNW